MSEQENRGDAAFEEEFSALERLRRRRRGHGRHHGLHPRLQSTRNSRSLLGAP